MPCLYASILFIVSAVVEALMALLFQFLWNWLAVGLFGAPVLDYWMAFWLMVLLSIIGGSLRSR